MATRSRCPPRWPVKRGRRDVVEQQEAHLGIARLGGEELVSLFEGLAQLPLFDKGLQILHGICPNGAADQAREEQGGGQGTF